MSDTYEMMTLADAAARLDYTQPCAVDTETIGWYGRIRLVQFYQRGWNKAIMVEYPNPFELSAVLTKLHCVGHNFHYDVTTVQEQLGRLPWMPEKFDDTFLLARLHFYAAENFALDDVVRMVLGHNPYEHNDQQKSDWSAPVLSEEQKRYAADDVVYLMQVYDVVKAAEEEYSYKLDIIATRYCLDFQCNGMPVDVQKLMEQWESNDKKIKELALPINCNSYQQVRAYIGSNMSDGLGLAKLALQGNERAKQVKVTRQRTKNNSFLKGYLDKLQDNDGRFGLLFGKFKCSARSGRTTSNDDNLQQIPRELKKIFGIDPEGDEVLIYTDYSAIQLRCVCVVTGDTAMETLFRAGADLHNFVAEMIFGKDFTTDNRQVAKTGNYTLLFAAGIITFINTLIEDADMWLTESQAGSFIKRWKGVWKHIADWQTKGIRDWKNGVVWQTPLGRKYRAKMMTDQLANQIQGFESEVAKLAMHYMMPKLKQLNASIKLRNFMHDSFMFTCVKDPAVYEEACIIIADAMQEAWRQMCQSVRIVDLPMPVRVRVGYNWGDLDKNNIFIHEHTQ